MNPYSRVLVLMALSLGGLRGLSQDITIEAESGSLLAPFVASNGCIFQVSATALTNGGRAEYQVNVATEGSYAVQLLVNAVAPSNNILGVSFDTEPLSACEVGQTSGFETRFVGAGKEGKGRGAPAYFELAPGTHALILRGAAPNVQIDRIMLFKRPAPPVRTRIKFG